MITGPPAVLAEVEPLYHSEATAGFMAAATYELSSQAGNYTQFKAKLRLLARGTSARVAAIDGGRSLATKKNSGRS
jgi:hypothetical protein